MQRRIERLARAHQQGCVAQKLLAIAGRSLQIGRIGQHFGKGWRIFRIDGRNTQQHQCAAVHHHNFQIGIKNGYGLAENLDGGFEALTLGALRFARQQQFGMGCIGAARHCQAQQTEHHHTPTCGRTPRRRPIAHQ